MSLASLYGTRVIVSDHMVETIQRELSPFEKFRCWVEGLADKAEIYYHYPRVQRSITKPMMKVVMLGDDLMVCHPIVYDFIKRGGRLPTKGGAQS